MEINPKFKPELVASREAGRLSITEPYLTGDTLVATDGKMLLAVPVRRDPHDADGYITGEALSGDCALLVGVFPGRKIA